ncbi:hypothetical protein GGI25_006095 [Coemansia spiralis]|uniref:Pre-mRNA-splicing factor SPF27 n=2 Tax=Coemansia TaxID=4863 RepID=A0A9W8KU23_9FUNG|nr:Pre-mRNA-splicing factor SPF27 [Coemansia spiralis]KAJ1990365.1 hypothetical protein EDC05_004129 [Coemansia umbellata]KAJ2620758.1 hypothetical protein GGI26_004746 [Coemansia sp. RSA 1358]KAJ2669601.1 hypothetical protein GGI25_006095 [Coemansia spiralis]
MINGQQILLDSLPYIDKEYDEPETRDQVLQMIQNEMGSMSPPMLPKDSSSLFKSKEILRKEYERVRAGKPLPEFEVSRYKLEAPSDDGDAQNVDAWRRACDNAASQLEHQSIRLVNLELLQNYGSNAWKLSNYQRERMLESIERATKKYKEEGIQINKARKYEQTEASIKLRELEDRWSESVRQCIEIQMASGQLKAEIEEIEQSLAEQQDS